MLSNCKGALKVDATFTIAKILESHLTGETIVHEDILKCTSRERQHIQALKYIQAGHHRRAVDIYNFLIIEEPHDLFTIKLLFDTCNNM